MGSRVERRSLEVGRAVGFVKRDDLRVETNWHIVKMGGNIWVKGGVLRKHFGRLDAQKELTFWK